MLPPNQVETFERFVDEVERVPAVGERPLGLGREQGVGESGRRKTGVDPREQGALGRLAMAHLCPAPQPALQNSWFRLAPEGGAFPPWGLTVTVGRHATRPVEQCEIGFLLRQRGQEIAERRKDRETNAPAVAVLSSEQRNLPHDVGFRDAGRELAAHRLGDDETDTVRKAVVQPLAPVRGGVGVYRRRPYQTSSLRTSTGKVGASSAHKSKVQPLSRSKRAWCQ
jgi:hypothetical protein